MSEIGIAIIGMGHVGAATERLFRGRIKITSYDSAKDATYPSEDIEDTQFACICVNTPSRRDGTADLSAVREALSDLPTGPTVVVRSTVPPGTCKALMQEFGRDIIVWPEYVGETSFAGQDWSHLFGASPFAVIGLASDSMRETMFLELLSHTYGSSLRIYRLTPNEAELVKYMENCYLATQVMFATEFRSLVEETGGRWLEVREAWLADPRVSRSHTQAFSLAPGFSGKCLPKDMKAILAFARSIDAPMPLMEAVESSNDIIQQGLTSSQSLLSERD